jgi:hypothetical protein
VSAILGEQHVVPLAAHIWLRLSFRLNFDFFLSSLYYLRYSHCIKFVRLLTTTLEVITKLISQILYS